MNSLFVFLRMKKNIVILSFLIFCVCPLWAQRTTVRLSGLAKEPVIVFTAKEVVLKFDKQSFLDTYVSMERGGWSEYYVREYRAATASIEWLRSQKTTVQLDENMTDQSKPETGLVWLVQNLVGAPLMIKGDAQIYEVRGNQKKEVLEFVETISALSGKSYAFYPPGKPNELLKIWNLNERVAATRQEKKSNAPIAAPPKSGEGETVEVVFEEPVEEVVINDDKDKIFIVVEVQPEYPGGMGKWNEYVKSSLRYPKDAVGKKVEGTVYVQFVVLETGKLSEFQLIRGISPSCDKEALRLCKESIDWKPGKQNGKTVKVRFVMPIKFRLSDIEQK